MDYTQTITIRVIDPSAGLSLPGGLADTGLSIWLVLFIAVALIGAAVWLLKLSLPTRRKLSLSGLSGQSMHSTSLLSEARRLKVPAVTTGILSAAAATLVLHSVAIAAPYLTVQTSAGSLNITVTQGQDAAVTSVGKLIATTRTNIDTEHTTRVSLDTSASSANFLEYFQANPGLPSAPAEQSAGHFGFAVASSESYLAPNDFDASYTEQYNTTSPSGRFAGITEQPIDVKVVPAGLHTTGTDAQYSTDFYFAITADGTIPAGVYTAVINIRVDDTSAPIPTVSYSTASQTNGDVTATIASSEPIQTPAGWTKVDDTTFTRAYSANTSETVTITDLAGHTADATITIANIDKVAPVIVVSPTETDASQGSSIPDIDDYMLGGVTATDDHDGILTGGVTYSVSPSFDIATLGAYTVTYSVTDSAGNTGTATRTVNVVDTDAPSGSVSYSITSPTNGDVTATITTSEPIVTPSGWTQVTGTTFTRVYAANTSETVTITDLSGNDGSVSVSIINIDKTAPTGSASYNTTSLTNTDVTVTITTSEPVATPSGWTSVTSTTFTRVYTANASESVTITDPAGNTGSVSIAIANIDKTAPTGSASYSTTAPTNANVTATITSSEPISTPAGWTSVTSTTFTRVYTANASETVTITDPAGNTGSVGIVITNIDKVTPVITVGVTPTSFALGAAINAMLAVTASDNVDGTITGNITTACVDEYLAPLSCVALGDTAGTHTVTYSVTDTAGNTGTNTRVYTVSTEPTAQWVKSDVSLLAGSSADDIAIDIDDGMLPIVNQYKTSTAPTYSSTAATEYANYDTHKWANGATLVDDKTTNSYDSDGTLHTDGSGTYTPHEYFLDHAPLGTPVPESDVLGYWTYIPRFAYEVQRRDAIDAPLAAQTRLDVQFETVAVGRKYPAATCSTGLPGDGIPANHLDYRTGCAIDRTYPTVALGDVNTSTTWATHPAFTLDPDGYPTNNDGDETELAGIWVAKFEAGQDVYCYNGSTLTSDCGNTLTTIAPEFKPYKAPQTFKYIGTQFTLSLGVQASHNLSASAGTRMMRNDDWGAVAYLSTSRYGIYHADGSPKQAKVYNNGYYRSATTANTANPAEYRYQTGCGPVASLSDSANTTCTQYHSTIGQQASTTGNVYGIYDLAGGAWEYTLGNRGKTNNNTYFPNANFTNPAYTAYINTYMVPPFGTQPAGSSATEYFYNNDICTYELCGGQSLHETRRVQSVSADSQSWGSDSSRVFYSSYPWLRRGGQSSSGAGAGVFASLSFVGYASEYTGWRSVQSK